jgi:hypothetical protein
VRVWDVETGRLLHQMLWPESIADSAGNARIYSLTVLPGSRLATALSDGDILIWDLAVATWPTTKPDFQHKPLEALWSDLERDARTARRAIRDLSAEPEQTVTFLSERLTPAVADRSQLENLLASLESDAFVEREAASRSLARIRDCVEPSLRQVLHAKPSLELRLRLEALLAEPKRLPIETVRTLRAIDVLERIGTLEARRILKKLTGSAAAAEAREAQAALKRMNRTGASANRRAPP